MFALKNHKTKTFTTFRPNKDGLTVSVCQVDGGECLGLDGDVSIDEARRIWKVCVDKGAVRVPCK